VFFVEDFQQNDRPEPSIHEKLSCADRRNTVPYDCARRRLPCPERGFDFGERSRVLGALCGHSADANFDDATLMLSLRAILSLVRIALSYVIACKDYAQCYFVAVLRLWARPWKCDMEV
jgi:hypothetical protein